jgi:hypothetical protein
LADRVCRLRTDLRRKAKALWTEASPEANRQGRSDCAPWTADVVGKTAVGVATGRRAKAWTGLVGGDSAAGGPGEAKVPGFLRDASRAALPSPAVRTVKPSVVRTFPANFCTVASSSASKITIEFFSTCGIASRLHRDNFRVYNLNYTKCTLTHISASCDESIGVGEWSNIVSVTTYPDSDYNIS